MKGIGILLVLLGHVWSQYIPHTHHVICSFHMPLFFLVVGYFSKTWSDWPTAKQTLRKYFVRLVIPMAVTQLAITLWYVLMALVQASTWQMVLSQLLATFSADVFPPPHMGGALGVVWFLLALFWAKVALLFLSRLKVWALPASVAIAIGTLLLHQVFPYSLWCLSHGLTALPFVVLGWWLRTHKAPLWLCLIAVLCWGVALFFLPTMDMYSFTYSHYLLNALGACGGTYVVYFVSRLIAQHTRFAARLFSYLGVISLAIMCVHCFEIDCHFGNHLRVALGLDLSAGWLYVWRYALTIALAVVLVHIPKVKKLFV